MLPPLREELSLHPGPTAADGASTWTLRDPVRNSFFRLGWAAFEILVRWTAGSPAAIQQLVHDETALAIEAHEVEALADFLAANQLLRPRTPADSVRLSRMAAAQKQSWADVIAGQTLFVFESPDDQERLAVVEAHIRTLAYQSQSVFFDAAFREQALVIREQLATAMAERMSLGAETARLTIIAAASGTVVDLLPDLHRGDWLSPREQLATIRGDGGSVIDAYVKESDLSRIKVGDAATFYSDAAEQPPLRRSIDMTATLLLTEPELASPYGGGIAVRSKKSGLAPEGAVYRVRLEAHGRSVPDAQLRGAWQISGQSETLVGKTARSVAAVVMRESGL